jgi:hypothetical protein
MDATATKVQRAAPRRSPRDAYTAHARSRATLIAWLWGALGLAGSVVLTLAGTRLAGPVVLTPKGDRPELWWFAPKLVSGHSATEALFYVGIAALVAAWVAIGWQISRSGAPSLRVLLAIGALWCLPLALGAPLFSRDVYSYLAQGTILHLGHNPYRLAPIALEHLGRRHTLQSVSEFWRHTTAPYGPLFLYIVGLFVAATGGKLVAGVILVRLLELLGVALLAVSVPRLARRVGGEARRAVWLVVLSPLVLLELVAPAHNDALMVGLMALAVMVALERSPALGIAICAAAATVKVPAAAAAVFIALVWMRGTPGPANRLRALTQAVAVFAAVIAAVSIGTGVGLSWVSGSVFSTPNKVNLAITPATAAGYTVATLLTDAGVAIGQHTLAHVFTRITFGLTGLYALWLLYRVRRETLVRDLGLLLVVAAVLGPAAWPWYLCWGLALLAACRKGPLWLAMPLVLIAGAVIIKPNGILAVPSQAAPYVTILYLVLLAIAVAQVARHKRWPPDSPPAVPGEAVLAGP